MNLDNPDLATEVLRLVAKQAKSMSIIYAFYPDQVGFVFSGVHTSILLQCWQG
ncbi:hypothetical protein M5G07_07135 [Serratia symbiotica]|nr:hypothetical protein [Serratia symbiotica]